MCIMFTTSKENNKLKKTLNSANKIIKYLNDLRDIKISLQKSIINDSNKNYKKILEEICKGLSDFREKFYTTLLFIYPDIVPHIDQGNSINKNIYNKLTNEQKSYKYFYKLIK